MVGRGRLASTARCSTGKNKIDWVWGVLSERGAVGDQLRYFADALTMLQTGVSQPSRLWLRFD
jgi:hypothetical protein